MRVDIRKGKKSIVVVVLSGRVSDIKIGDHKNWTFITYFKRINKVMRQ